MAAVAPQPDLSIEAAGLLQNLSLGSQSKTKTNLDLPDVNTKAPNAQMGTVDSKNAPNGHISTNNMDASQCYFPNNYQHAAYYYGYDGAVTEWDDYSRYVNADGSQGVYGDNGSLMYHHGYGYAPYGPYSPATSPVPTIGHENQLYAPQQYQYPSPYFSPVAPTTGTFTSPPAAAPQMELPSTAASQLPLSVETGGIDTPAVANGGGKVANGTVPVKPDHQDSSFSSKHGRSTLPSGFPISSYQDPRFGSDGFQSPLPWLDAQAYVDGQNRSMTGYSYAWSSANTNQSSKNHNSRSNTNVMGQNRPMSGMGNTHGFMNRIYPSKLYGQYGNAVKSGMAYGSGGHYGFPNGNGWYPVDSRYRNSGRSNGYFRYGNETMDGLNELNRGPRAKISKSQKAFSPITLAVKGQVIPSIGNLGDEKSNLTAAPDREQYNHSDFPDTYSQAKFFIIKSYSEDDIHKSIKYNVWSSTPNGNKKLDAAYREAQEKSGGCPVFLLFSVNTSGQFVGLAEMVGAVDFEKSVEYWQQDKWNGSFPLKWHIVKDVPNSLLKHITLENNENKPVTNSRDTQEVKLEQGLQVVKIFKEHASKTSILDDFGFYEGRQKMIQERKVKQQQFRKQAWEGKNYGEKNKEGQNGEQNPQIAVVGSESLNEAGFPVVANGDVKPSENGLAAISGNATENVKTTITSENTVAK